MYPVVVRGEMDARTVVGFWINCGVVNKPVLGKERWREGGTWRACRAGFVGFVERWGSWSEAGVCSLYIYSM